MSEARIDGHRVIRPDGPSPVDGKMSRQLHSLWAYVIPAASIIGIVIYGMLRQLYAGFYGSLGASPEEVGFGYSETLSLSGVAMLWVLILPSACVLLALTAASRLRHGNPTRDRVRQIAPSLIVVMLALGVVAIFWTTWDATSRAYSGRAVTAVNIGPIQLLGLRAEPATVWWQSGRATEDPDLTSGTCLLYLGQANGTTVLYDPGSPTIRTIRVETADVIVDVVRGRRGPGQPRGAEDVRCENHHVAFS